MCRKYHKLNDEAADPTIYCIHKIWNKLEAIPLLVLYLATLHHSTCICVLLGHLPQFYDDKIIYWHSRNYWPSRFMESLR